MTASIKLVAIDLDGTLLNSQHELSERNEKAIKSAVKNGVTVILATGKTRSSALKIIEQLKLDSPGIYVQGLVTHAADGSIIQQTTLDKNIIRQVITFAEDREFSLVAYSGTRTLVRARNRDTNIFVEYGEPQPEVVGPLQNILDDTPINKIAAIHRSDPRRVTALRWQLNMQINGTARLMQAGVPEMVEILPSGASKGAAFKRLLKSLNIDSETALSIGDGENDIEMLQHAGIGIAVGNAGAAVKKVADHIVATNDADGVAEALEKFVLPPPIKVKATSAASKPETMAPSTQTVENKVENQT